jgi:hypothetical protein
VGICISGSTRGELDSAFSCPSLSYSTLAGVDASLSRESAEPEWILTAHVPNQGAHLFRHRRPWRTFQAQNR